VLALRVRPRSRQPRRILAAWPWILPSILGILLYQQVHLEHRYIAGFVAVLFIAPVLGIELWGAPLSPKTTTVMMLLIVLGGTADLLVQLRQPIVLALHRAPVQTAGQWRIAHYLTAAGLRPGDKVASVSDANVIRCAWAYGARVRIVAAIGNDAYDGYAPDQLRDLHRFFDDPAVQARDLDLFRQQGAVAVVAPDLPFSPADPGWQSVSGTHAWVLLLR
jgi:hypothetical protein